MHITSNSENTIAAIGESELIRSIRKWLGPVAPPAPAGMGDDCAVLQPSEQLQLITTDSLSYQVHFDDSVSAENAGAKLIKRNLSDIAAMGGQPQHAVLALLCGPDISTDWLESFFTGIRSTCLEYKIQIVGGDISALPAGQFSAVLTLFGTTESARLRTTAKSGDWLYVSGTLGGSIIQKHWRFTPHMQEGRWLAQRHECSAMMDLTDGLAKDLNALIPEGCQAALDLPQIPLSADALIRAAQTGRPPLEHAFCDGEDYELLFSIRTEDPAIFEAAWAQCFPKLKLSRIGRLCPATKNGSYVNAQTGEAIPWIQGYEHLTKP